jgi:hypothetical protein
MTDTMTDTDRIARSLKSAKAPKFMAMLVELEDCQMTVSTETGGDALLSIDTYKGKRTATLEYTDDRVLSRFSVDEEGFTFTRSDLSDGALQIDEAKLSFRQICEPDARLAIAEFFEEIS